MALEIIDRRILARDQHEFVVASIEPLYKYIQTVYPPLVSGEDAPLNQVDIVLLGSAEFAQYLEQPRDDCVSLKFYTNCGIAVRTEGWKRVLYGRYEDVISNRYQKGTPGVLAEELQFAVNCFRVLIEDLPRAVYIQKIPDSLLRALRKSRPQKQPETPGIVLPEYDLSRMTHLELAAKLYAAGSDEQKVNEVWESLLVNPGSGHVSARQYRKSIQQSGRQTEESLSELAYDDSDSAVVGAGARIFRYKFDSHAFLEGVGVLFDQYVSFDIFQKMMSGYIRWRFNQRPDLFAHLDERTKRRIVSDAVLTAVFGNIDRETMYKDLKWFHTALAKMGISTDPLKQNFPLCQAYFSSFLAQRIVWELSRKNPTLTLDEYLVPPPWR